MTILVFGRNGQVARELARLKPDAIFLGRDEADLSKPDAAKAAIEAIRPKAVLNAAAYTQVDNAETEQELAFAINADAPGEMAAACARAGIPILHLSTDYVFDGSRQSASAPYDPTAPLNVYGSSKRAGETLIEASGTTYAVLRTSWVFSSTGANFVKTMLRLSEQHKVLRIVADQIGGPTPAAAIAETSLKMLATIEKAPQTSGIYHFSGAPDCSWADFAQEIFRQARRDTEVQRISTAEFPTRAKRPQNSRLDCRSTWDTFGIGQPDWRRGLGIVLEELGVKQA